MSYLWVAFIVSVVGGFNPNFNQLKEDGHGKWLLGWIIRSVVALILWVGIVYAVCPGLYGPFWGLSFMILLTMSINLLITGITSEELPGGTYLFVVLLVLVLIRGILSMGMFQSVNLRDMIGKVEDKSWQDDFQPIDTKHIRIIDQEHAEWLGNQDIGKIPGNIGSRFHVGTLHIQRVKDELWWVAPLEFNGFASWQSYGETYGFIMVNAEDRNRPVRIEQRKLKYVTTGWFSDNLRRYVYAKGYQFTGLTDFTFEVDDELNPYWVITKYDLIHHYTGDKVTGVILVNAETGEIEKYKPEEAPVWVDRIIPQKIAFSYAKWRGKYTRGWWNSIWSEQDVMIPTEVAGKLDMWLVYGNDGQPYWFTGMTSSSASDNALVGFLMINSRNAKSYFYRINGANETAVIQAVSSGLGAESAKWHPTDPILYNIYGTLTWVVPILSDQHVFQRIAMVEASSSRVAFGQDKTELLAEYRKLLASNGNTMAPSNEKYVKKAEGKIKRIAADSQNGVTIYYVWLDQMPDKLFSGTSKISEELAIARDNDQAKITYLETNEGIIQMASFDLPDVEFTKSEIQQASDAITVPAQAEAETNTDNEEVKRRLDNLTPEQLKQLEQLLSDKP